MSARPDEPAAPRRAPRQKRSRERVERILATAAELLAENGAEGFRMSDVVERAGISFGSLYQYFPDKSAVIAALAERTNEEGRRCVETALADVTDAASLHVALGEITDRYYEMFAGDPLLRAVWGATQADPALQALDAAEGALLAGMLLERLGAVAPGAVAAHPAEARAAAQMLMVLIAAAVRHAIELEPDDARAALRLFKATLPEDLPGFIAA